MLRQIDSNNINIKLEAGVLIALADLTTISHRIAERTWLTGTASWLDILLLAPGIHLQQQASSMANVGGETPEAAELNTQYVFRIENSAIVGYLQRVGHSGRLVEVEVFPTEAHPECEYWHLSGFCYCLALAVTIAGTAVLLAYGEWWTVGSIAVLMLTRAINVILIKQRATVGWTGWPEPGVPGDLFILLSQNRWIRMRGMIDDIKAVTSGQWLHNMDTLQSFLAGTASLLVYMTASVAGNSSTFGNVVLVSMLLIEVALLSLSNKLIQQLLLFGRVVRVRGDPGGKNYPRRKDMAIDLVKEKKKEKWAVSMGLLKAEDAAEVLRHTKPHLRENKSEEVIVAINDHLGEQNGTPGS